MNDKLQTFAQKWADLAGEARQLEGDLKTADCISQVVVDLIETFGLQPCKPYQPTPP
jgi:hypothetical protein